MSEQLAISAANLAVIESSLSALNNNISTVSGQVTEVGRELVSTKSELENLVQEFHTFVQADLKAKELQLADTRIINVRQELAKTFGHYDTVRRHTTGILQAADLSFVRKETITLATEQLMLDAPRYWLAPALVALSAWLADSRPLAERALSAALSRDDRKVSLFFALITRRGGRHLASRQWLDRYFAQQDCRALDRETVILLDAVAYGIFGAEGRAQCAARMKEWLTDLGAAAGFIDLQRQRWSAALRFMLPRIPGTEYPYLRRQCPDWSSLEPALAGARLHAQVAAWSARIFTGEIHVPPQVAVAVDDLLDKLVARFDDEELPLRRDERKLALIIEENGDKLAAEKRFDLDKEALEQTVDFTQLLTNAALNPETAGATLATQRMAIALSREWIIAAHDEISAQNRAATPLEVKLAIGNWSGTSRDGSNEGELVASLARHSLAKQTAAVAAVKLTPIHWGAVVLGVVLLFAGWPFPAVLGIAAIAWVGWVYFGLEKRRTAIIAQHTAGRENDTKLLRATLAELVDWRKDYAKADAEAEQVRASLAAANPEEHLQTRYESGRAIS